MKSTKEEHPRMKALREMREANFDNAAQRTKELNQSAVDNLMKANKQKKPKKKAKFNEVASDDDFATPKPKRGKRARK